MRNSGLLAARRYAHLAAHIRRHGPVPTASIVQISPAHWRIDRGEYILDDDFGLMSTWQAADLDIRSPIAAQAMLLRLCARESRIEVINGCCGDPSTEEIACTLRRLREQT